LDPQGLAARILRSFRIPLRFLQRRQHVPGMADFIHGQAGMELVKRHGFLRELARLVQLVLLAEEVGEMVKKHALRTRIAPGTGRVLLSAPLETFAEEDFCHARVRRERS
jgi:hypothetical protein